MIPPVCGLAIVVVVGAVRVTVPACGGSVDGGPCPGGPAGGFELEPQPLRAKPAATVMIRATVFIV
jgi:hypothetical protein